MLRIQGGSAGPLYRRRKSGEWIALAENAADKLRMKCGDCAYTWAAKECPAWRCDLGALAQPLAEVSRAHGVLLGRLTGVGVALRDINDLLARGILRKTEAGGRSTIYELLIG